MDGIMKVEIGTIMKMEKRKADGLLIMVTGMWLMKMVR
jgi:hypothetical protein